MTAYLYNNQIRMMEEASYLDSSDRKNSERVSGTTECTESEEREEDLQIRYANVESEAVRFYRVNLFTQNCSKRPSLKLNRSAVGWIQTTCFVKGYDIEVTALAVTLYYAYISNFSIDKSRLQLLLATIVFMAQKFCGPRSMNKNDLRQLTSENFISDQVFELQATLFKLMEMDFIVQTVFEYIAEEKLSHNVQSGVTFLIEVFLLKDGAILFDEEKCQTLIDLVEDPIHQCRELEELRELLTWKQVDNLKNKYMSQFDVDVLIKKLTA